MPRKKYKFLPGREDVTVNCFAFYRTGAGVPACRALQEIYCLKDTKPCVFFTTPEQFEADRRKYGRKSTKLS